MDWYVGGGLSSYPATLEHLIACAVVVAVENELRYTTPEISSSMTTMFLAKPECKKQSTRSMKRQINE
jgi:hypothetical protein